MSRTSIRRSAATALAMALMAAVPTASARAQDHCAQTKKTDQEKPATPASRSPRMHAMLSQPEIGDVPLVDQDGRATTLREALEADGPVFVNFIFTTCTTICPVMSAGFSQFREELGDRRNDVRLVSISVDPDNDTVEVLQQYAARQHADAGWRFLTGSREASIAAQRAFGAYRGDKMNHLPSTYVRPGRGAPWQVVEGLSSAQTLRRAWDELSNGTGTLASR